MSSCRRPPGALQSLRLLNRFEESSSGRLHICGRPLDSYGVPALRRRVALVALVALTPAMLAESVGGEV